MEKNLYEILEIEKTASKSQIKKAYYKLSKKYHPDVEGGGDEEMFNKIKQAYDVLSDDYLRGVYDETGVIENKVDMDSMFMSFISTKIVEVLEHASDGSNFGFMMSMSNISVDVIAISKEFLEKDSKSILSQKKKLIATKETLEKEIKKIKFSGGEDENMIAKVIKSRIMMYDTNINQCDRKIEINKYITERLKDYSYEKESTRIGDPRSIWKDIDLGESMFDKFGSPRGYREKKQFKW